MADNATAPIAMSDVAAHVGISMRSLQAGFRQWRGTQPHIYLRNIRLQGARQDLRAGEASVTDVALRYGFANLGRFSAYYRAAFGELPSDTRLRTRRHARRKI